MRFSPDSSKFSDENYENANVTLLQDISPPSYQNVWDWLKITKDRHVAFDFWARGNYTRRLIYQRNHGTSPLLVRVSRLDEIRWAYRHLALSGLPIEFVYLGANLPVRKCLNVTVFPNDLIIDAGWGYLAVPMDKKYKGHQLSWLLCNARFMPEAILDWLVEEVPEEFVKGKVFISPDVEIGLDTQAAPLGLGTLATVAGGVPVISEDDVAKAIVELDIPYLDNMSSKKFRKFLADYEGELIRFQTAFKKAVTATGKSEQQMTDYIEELKYEIAEFMIADKYNNVRKNIAKLGGVLGTFSASLAMAVSTDPSSMLPLVGAAGMGAAATSLLSLWNQAVEHERDMSKNPYYLLWKLGISKPSQVRKSSRPNLIQTPRPSVEQLQVPVAHHWLCPPTPGVEFVFAVKE
jgi:hypothetical protein